MIDAISSDLIAGFIGTLVLSTILRAASELGWTRMDLAFLLGTTVTVNRRKAKAIGYAIHFLLGMLFAIAYGLFFVVVDQSTWWLGAILGALHAVFVSTVLVNILLPVVHPRMGTPETAANEIALVEPPGFLMLNYGRNTFLITFLAHIAYGIVVALVVRR
jgi:uncharacterized membrane protein YagU involved in acid resistance